MARLHLPFSLLFFSLLIAAATAESGHLIRLPTDNNLCPRQPDSTTCPVKCFRTDPVCGADGITYWCGCAEAACAGTRVVKLGFCEVKNGGSGGQAFLLVHIVWLVLLGFSIILGFL